MKLKQQHSRTTLSLPNHNFIHKYNLQTNVQITKKLTQTHFPILFLLHVTFVSLSHTELQSVKISFILFFIHSPRVYSHIHIPSYTRWSSSYFIGTIQVSQVWYFPTNRPNHSFQQNQQHQSLVSSWSWYT